MLVTASGTELGPGVTGQQDAVASRLLRGKDLGGQAKGYAICNDSHPESLVLSQIGPFRPPMWGDRALMAGGLCRRRSWPQLASCPAPTGPPRALGPPRWPHPSLTAPGPRPRVRTLSLCGHRRTWSGTMISLPTGRDQEKDTHPLSRTHVELPQIKGVSRHRFFLQSTGRSPRPSAMFPSASGGKPENPADSVTPRTHEGLAPAAI